MPSPLKGLGVAVGLVVLTALPGRLAGAPLESWDQVITDPTRFVVLAGFGQQAVLDRETQLVWEQSPDGAVRTWDEAAGHCYNRVVPAVTRAGAAARKGWRLPSIEELASLVDLSQGPPTLPAGHPFTLPTARGRGSALVFWSATSTGHGSAAFIVFFTDGQAVAAGEVAAIGKPAKAPAWCVRGPGGIFEGQ